jgi:hypothetical protein
MPQGTPAPAQKQLTPQQLNQLQSQAVRSQAVELTQQIYNQTVFPPSQPQIVLNPRPVGLAKRFFIEVLATLNNTSGTVAQLTDFALGNLLSNVTFVDLNNNTRINTSGNHLNLLSIAKRKGPLGSTPDNNIGTGNNRAQMLNVPAASWPVFQAPQTIAAGGNATVRAVFELPLSYSDDNLAGAIYLGVVQNQAQITITFNPAPFSGAAPADNTNAVYQNGAGTISQATVSVYQVYLDQLPIGNNGIILPQLDISTVYELKQSILNPVVPGFDFQIPFASYRDFYSTFLIFNNNGQSTGRNFGTDINYLALQSANFTNLWKIDPLLHQQNSREVLDQDTPAGCYYSSFRKRPISTLQYGNMEQIINASTATGNSYVQVLWEDMGIINSLTNGSSLASQG